MNPLYDPDIIRRESYYDRRYGVGTSTAMKAARYASAAYRSARKAAEAYAWYKVAKGPKRDLSDSKPSPTGATNKSRSYASKSSFPENDRGRKRLRSEDLTSMVRNVRRRTPARSRSRGRSRNRRPSVVRSRSRSRGRNVNRRRVSRGAMQRYRRALSNARRYRRNLINIPNPARYGASHVVERSGVFSADTNGACYLGHGCDTEQFWVNVCRAIVRKLYRDAGEEIYDWEVPVSGALNSRFLQIAWQTNVDSDNLLLDNTLIGAISYNGVASVLYSRFTNLFVESDSNIVIQHVSLFNNVAVTGDSLTTSRLVMSDTTVYYKLTSMMKLQNASIAGTTTVDQADEDSTNVTKNPLVGKLYYSKSRQNGFKLSVVRALNPPTDDVITVAGRGTGVVLWGTSATTSALMNELYRKPPPGRQFNLKAVPWGISPGQIKSITWTDTRKIKLHTLIEKLKTSFTQNITTQYQNVGKFQMVGLEKKMACQSNENPIVVHWALEQHHQCVVTKTLGRCNRITQIVVPA